MAAPLKYFQAEKTSCILGAVFATLSIVAAAYFLFSIRHPFYTAMSYPVLILGLFFLIICTTIVLRIPYDIHRVTSAFELKSSSAVSQEKMRMEKVMISFRAIIIIELVLIAASIVIILAMNDPVWRGIAVGVLIEGSFFLGFDVIARMRAKDYLQFLSGPL
jgi:hypothetical protein